MDVNDQAVDTLIKGITDYINSALEKAGATTMHKTTVWAIDSENKLYTVALDKQQYKVKNGLGVDLHVGQSVWVTVPNGIMRDMFISGLR